MRPTHERFLQELEHPEDRTFNLVLEGMSGMGKSFWAQRLAGAYRYPFIELDERISAVPAFRMLLEQYPGQSRAEQLGHFLGAPGSSHFSDREKMYLATEAQAMHDVAGDAPGGKIIDLSGSAIYHIEAMRKIAARHLIIYLETEPDERKRMVERYLSEPKPVCFRGLFRPEGEEDFRSTLARVYPLLLQTRETLYRAFADVTLPQAVHRGCSTPETLIGEIAGRLAEK